MAIEEAREMEFTGTDSWVVRRQGRTTQVLTTRRSAGTREPRCGRAHAGLIGGAAIHGAPIADAPRDLLEFGRRRPDRGLGIDRGDHWGSHRLYERIGNVAPILDPSDREVGHRMDQSVPAAVPVRAQSAGGRRTIGVCGMPSSM